ncbi:MAG: putative manganese transporter [Brevinemataceae bacterium]
MFLFDIIYNSAVAAFIQVGTFVAMTLFVFGFVEYKTEGKLTYYFSKYKKIQVILGSLLGLTPGCGGAIIVIPLYLTGKVSFGTLAATLIATMGDAAFVLIVLDPKIFVIVSIISFIAAIVTGYVLDYFGVSVKPRISYTLEALEQKNQIFQSEESVINNDASDQTKSLVNYNIIFYYFRHHVGYVVFWIFAVLCLPLGILNLMQVNIDTDLAIKNLGWIGAIGTFFAVIYSFISKKYFSDDTLSETNSKIHSLKETFIHNAEETAFVIMWVFIALCVYEIFLYVVGGEEVLRGWMAQTGYLSVIIAIAIGNIPGCGPQILLAVLYTQGLFPLSALVANAICNDGDALFPLIAVDRRSTFYAKLYNIIPAFIIGTLMFLLGY